MEKCILKTAWFPPAALTSSKLASTGQMMDPLALIGAERRPQLLKALEDLQATSESASALRKEFWYVANHPHMFLPKASVHGRMPSAVG